MRQIKKATIAAIIGCENNPELLDKCLSKLNFVDELWITDLSKNDEIKNLLLAKYPNARHFFDIDRNVKNRILKYQELISCDFILAISPDEFFSHELQQEILDLFSSKDILEIDSIGFKSQEYHYGTNFGLSAYYTYRLLRKGLIKFEKDNVHEEIMPVGNKKNLNHFYEHHSNPMLGINAVKMFKFEMINAADKSVEEIQNKSLQNLSGFKFYWHIFKQIIKINFRFYKSFKAYRKFGYGGLCIAYSSIIRTIAEHISPTQELQFREGRVDRNDTRGYL